MFEYSCRLQKQPLDLLQPIFTKNIVSNILDMECITPELWLGNAQDETQKMSSEMASLRAMVSASQAELIAAAQAQGTLACSFCWQQVISLPSE